MNTPEESLNQPFTVELNRYGKELYKFDKRAFKKLLGPGVYVAKTPLEFLYVGSSKNIFGRVSNKHHVALRSALDIEGCEIIIISAASESQARSMESWLIAENQPRFNKAGRKGSAYNSISEKYSEFEVGGAAAILKEEFAP